MYSVPQRAKWLPQKERMKSRRLVLLFDIVILGTAKRCAILRNECQYAHFPRSLFAQRSFMLAYDSSMVTVPQLKLCVQQWCETEMVVWVKKKKLMWQIACTCTWPCFTPRDIASLYCPFFCQTGKEALILEKYIQILYCGTIVSKS